MLAAGVSVQAGVGRVAMPIDDLFIMQDSLLAPKSAPKPAPKPAINPSKSTFTCFRFPNEKRCY